jgi:hypothetical protein
MKSHTIRISKQHLGYKHDSLIDISPESIVIDTLHKFLRVTYVLVDLLLDGIFRSDEMFTNILFNPSMHTNLSSFSNFITAHCHLKTFEMGDKTENIRNLFKSIMGTQKRVLFERKNTNNNICKLFKHLYKK